MEVVRTIEETRSAVRVLRRGDDGPIALVPTMGALHAGHLALIDAARRDGGQVVVSIFVNPTQFGPGEDLDQYPRDEAGDLAKCEQAGAALALLPAVADMYPPDAVTHIHVARLTETLCGPWRPVHFNGVTTVVAKLFNIVQPDRAYFGEKDFQQLQVIRRMVADLNFPTEIVGCATVREPDGLALSSRNAYLAPAARQQAAVLHVALEEGAALIRSGETEARSVAAEMRRLIVSAGPCDIQYVEIVDPRTLQPVRTIAGPVRIALAVVIAGVRLIDNVGVDPASTTA